MAKLHLEGGVTFEGTPEEIKAYTDLYAEGGAEKAQEKPEPAQSFKEGDIVVITGNTNAHGFEIGTVGKITCLDVSDDQHKVSSLDGHDWWWLEESEMRHATQAEREQYEESLKPKLKAGDWVKFTSYKGIVNREDISLNKAYQVFTDTDDELAFVDDAGDRCSQPLRDKEAYEIVAPPSVFERIGRKEGEFKVGDVVRVIGDDVLGGENKDGDIGVVTSSSRWTGNPQVRVSGRGCGNDGNGWFAPAHYFELIAPVESRVDRSNRGDASCD